MLTLEVINRQGDVVKSLEVKSDLFSADSGQALVHSAVVMQRAASRQGTASTKGRGEVSGTGRKPWKQKHTGRARAGSNRSPIWRHGGIVFGPQPREYGFSMPKRMYRAAMQAALSGKISSWEFKVISDFSIPEPKARHVQNILKNLGVGAKALIVVGEGSGDLMRAGKNIANIKMTSPAGLNVYDVLRYNVVLVLEEEMAKVEELWG